MSLNKIMTSILPLMMKMKGVMIMNTSVRRMRKRDIRVLTGLTAFIVIKGTLGRN